MDVKEFKAWFEGFCESIGETPSADQFAKIKAKVATIETGPKYNLRDGLAPRVKGWPGSDGPHAAYSAIELTPDLSEPVGILAGSDAPNRF